MYHARRRSLTKRILSVEPMLAVKQQPRWTSTCTYQRRHSILMRRRTSHIPASILAVLFVKNLFETRDLAPRSTPNGFPPPYREWFLPHLPSSFCLCKTSGSHGVDKTATLWAALRDIFRSMQAIQAQHLHTASSGIIPRKCGER